MKSCHDSKSDYSNKLLINKSGSWKIALAGSPNVGKSTIFNSLCGLKQHVGNWPGKTVEKKVGRLECGGREIEIMDLPGIYSLSALSAEEIISRDYIVQEKPDLVVNIIDASNLERNLLFTMELLELTPRVLIVLNMMDVAKVEGYKIEAKQLENLLGVRVVTMVATDKEDIQKLLSVIFEEMEKPAPTKVAKVDYKDEEKTIEELTLAMGEHPPYPFRFAAVKALEEDEMVVEHLQLEGIKIPTGRPQKMSQYRHSFVEEIVEKVLKKKRKGDGLTDKIDRVVLSPLWGIPILLGTIFFLFYITFTVSPFFQNLIEKGFSALSELMRGLLLEAPKWVQGLVIDGIIAGVGGVMTFLPLITIFFLLFSILESSGYLSRIAYLLDRLMGLVGLQGKVFFSFLMGYGCNIAGVMATRILEKEEDRVLAVLLNPLIPCGARLGVMAMIAGAFFGTKATLVVVALILLDLLLIFLVGAFFRRYLIKTEPPQMVMELPLYHLPHLKTILLFALERIKAFLYRAGTVIVALSLIVWVLASFPAGTTLSDSFLGQIGRVLMPVTRLMGFDNELTTSLLTGLVAKEATLSTLAVLYGTGEEGLATVLPLRISPLVALVYLIVTILYIPCIATMGSIYKETGSLKWTIFTIVYNLFLATAMGILVYQVGVFLGWG